MRTIPFSVRADIDLGSRLEPYLVGEGQDVTVKQGVVPDEIEDASVNGVAFSASADQFRMQVPNGVSFLVSGGDTILYDRGGMSDREVALFLSGSAWGALCYQRALLPLHASAIYANGNVHAFTGPSGAGKSTLSAALAEKGRDFFTDDVLVIDPEEIGKTTRCYTGQKDLKLWKDALALTGATPLDRVRDAEDFEKFYAKPARSNAASAGDLVSLSILASSNDHETDEPFAIKPIQGAMALKHLRESIYRPRFANAIWGRKRIFETLANVIENVRVQTFDRPLDKSQFDAGISYLDCWIENRESGASNTVSAKQES